jgi:dihydrofolate reductase
VSKTILYIATSLDGYVAGKDDDLSWLNAYQDVDYDYEAFFSRIGAIIEGRRTYDIEVKNGWKNAHPVPLFVLSKNTPVGKPARSDVTFLHDDIADVLKAAKEKAGRKDVWIEGGANVAQQFINRGLVDEMILTLVPVFLGQGIRLFENIHAFPIVLQTVRRFDRGLVELGYELNKECCHGVCI